MAEDDLDRAVLMLDEEVPETPAAETPAAPAAPQKRIVSLDEDILPDVDDLPPTRRGQSVRSILEDRKEAIRQRDVIGTRAKELESQNLVLQKALEIVTGKQQQAPAPKPQPTTEERLRQRVDPSTIIVDPASTLAGVVDTAQEAIQPKIAEAVQPVQDRVARLEAVQAQNDARTAFKTAGEMLKADPGKWYEIDNINEVARVVEREGLPQNDPNSYVAAAQWLDQVAQRRANIRAVPPPTTEAAAAPTQAATPPVTAPSTPPAPPVGGAPAGAESPAQPTLLQNLTNHDRDALAATREGFGFDEATWNEIEQAVNNERAVPARRGRR